jgi:transposase-like protein
MEKRVEERRGVAPGEVEGARRLSGASPGAADGPLGPGQRWSRSRKRAVALRLLRGESVDAVSRELGVPMFRLEAWREAALAGIDAALTSRQEDKVSAELDAALKLASASSPWRTSCCGRGAAPRALWPIGGRSDEHRDLPRHQPALRREAGVCRLGRAPLQLLPPPAAGTATRAFPRSTRPQSPRSRTRGSWPPFAPTWHAPR